MPPQPGGQPPGYGPYGYGYGHGPPQPPPPKKSNVLLIVGVVVGVVFLCGIVSAVGVAGVKRYAERSREAASEGHDDDDGRRSSRDEPSDDDGNPPRGNVLTARDGVTTMTLPSSWRKLHDLNAEADLEAGNPLLDEYAIVITEHKVDFAGTITLERYADLNLSHMRKTLTGAEISSPDDLTIDGRDAVEYEVRGAIDGINVAYLVTYVDGRKHMHQIVTWTLRSRFDSTRERLARATRSLREK